MKNNPVQQLAKKTLCGRYEIRDLIGRGGMGAVYEAFDRQLQEVIAIKVLADEGLMETDAVQRLQEEALITSRLNHPAIINVYDFQRDGEIGFITMERLQGGTLRRMMDERSISGQTFTEDESILYAVQISEAHQYAHLFTVHRDLKPENIWLLQNGGIKLMDFGLAKFRLDQTRFLTTSTQTGIGIGSPYYLAPEQLQDAGSVDAQSDQYSLGVILYEMVTGGVPAGMARPLKEERPDMSSRFCNTVERSLSRQPENRFESIEEFKNALSGTVETSRWIPRTKFALAATVLSAFILGVLGLSAWEQFRFPQSSLRHKYQQNLLHHQVSMDGSIQSLMRHQQDSVAREGDAELHSESDKIEKAVHNNWRQGRIDLAINRLDRQTAGISEQGRLLAERTLETALNAAQVWKTLLNTNLNIVDPDLVHLADPKKSISTGEAFFEEWDYQAAHSHYLKAAETYRNWTRELRDLDHRTDQQLTELKLPYEIRTNVLGMPFIRIDDLQYPFRNYKIWISLWETRVIDYARFAADGPLTQFNFQSSDLWKTMGFRQKLTHPVVGVSYDDSMQFCRWLDRVDEKNEGGLRTQDLGKPSYRPMDPLLWLEVEKLLRIKSPELLKSQHLNRKGIYAFSLQWPPFVTHPDYENDKHLNPSHYIVPVASRSPNALGLFDWDGNAWEWVYGQFEETPHWLDGEKMHRRLVNGGFFGQVAFVINRQQWPTINPDLSRIGRLQAIGLRVVAMTEIARNALPDIRKNLRKNF